MPKLYVVVILHPRRRGLGTYLVALMKNNDLTGFGSPFGSPGASLGDPGGTHFRLGPDGPQVALGGTWQATWSPGSSGGIGRTLGTGPNHQKWLPNA